MTETKPKRRWFRFSLRTLLVVVTLAAVGSWGYWVVWPWWCIYREQCQFEASAKQLHVGNTTFEILSPESPVTGIRGMNWYPFTHQPAWGWFVRGWPNAVYVGVFLIRDPSHPGWLAGLFGISSKEPFKSVALYRLSPTPADFQPFSASVRDLIPRFVAKYPEAEKKEYFYAADFLDFITGDRKTNPGFKYELIYSDPPNK